MKLLPENSEQDIDQKPLTREQQEALADWARTHCDNGGHGMKFTEIATARHKWVIRNRILLAAGLFTVIGGGTAIGTHTDEIGQWFENDFAPWVEEKADGFGAWWDNGHQRADYPGFTPTNPKLALEVDCLAEEFHDQDAENSITHNHIGGNSWKRNHCEGVLDPIYADPRFKEDPAAVIGNRKNAILRELGIQSESDRFSAVEWRSYGGLIGHRFDADQKRLEQAYKAQSRNGQTPRFRYK